MVKRRDLVGEVKAAGLVSKGGSKHEVFEGNGHRTAIPRHREIGEKLADQIRKQAGIKK